MPIRCTVSGCKSRFKKNKDIRFHRFPRDETIKNEWLSFCGPQNKRFNINSDRICSLHFESKAYKRNLKYEMLELPLPSCILRLNLKAVPTLNGPPQKSKYLLLFYFKNVIMPNFLKLSMC